MSNATLLKNALLVTMNREREIVNGDLLIEDGKISHIGGTISNADQAEVIECSGKWIFPGFIQGHVHLCQTLFRNQAEELPLLEWLQKRVWPYEGAHTAETIRVSSKLGLAELIRSGTTTLLDMGTVNHTEEIFHVADEVGIRGFFGKGLMDHESMPSYLSDKTEHAIKEASDLCEKWHEHDHGRLNYVLCPRFVLSCTEQLWKEITIISEQNNLFIHTHASENRQETEFVKQMTGLGNIAYFHKLGITGPRLAVAHCIWLEDHELEILSSTQTRVLHCPTTNLKLGSGIAQVKEFLNAGVKVLLGSDGAPANNRLNILDEMKLASLLQLPIHGPKAFPAKKIVELVTIDAAKALMIDETVGSLEVGKDADLIIIDPKTTWTLPEGNVYDTVVYSCTRENVESLFVRGKQLLRGGELLTIDEKQLIEDVPMAWDKIKSST